VRLHGYGKGGAGPSTGACPSGAAAPTYRDRKLTPVTLLPGRLRFATSQPQLGRFQLRRREACWWLAVAFGQQRTCAAEARGPHSTRMTRCGPAANLVSLQPAYSRHAQASNSMIGASGLCTNVSDCRFPKRAVPASTIVLSRHGVSCSD
jgi:hypothetical protein